MQFEKRYKDCYAFFNDNILTIGNNTIERMWDMKGNIPIVVSLKNKKSGKEWFGSGEEKGWLPGSKERYAFMKAQVLSGRKSGISIKAELDDDLGVSRTCLRVEVKIEYEGVEVAWIHKVYPGIPLHRSYICCQGEGLFYGISIQKQEDGLENLELVKKTSDILSHTDDYTDYFPLLPKHCKWKLVRFNDRTDIHNNLVKTDEGLFYRTEKAFLTGNLCFVKEQISDDGLTLIKEGPTPYGYQGEMKSDFYIEGKNIYSSGWGFTAEELYKYKTLSTYGSAVMVWEGSQEDALLLLQDYHRAVHQFVPEKDAFVMSNTWGDRSKDGKLSESFILKELELAERLGVNYFQIDDGWQNGVTSNSTVAGGVWEGYYRNNPDFWEVHKQRFPRGLAPISLSADEKGIKLALWFSPDSSDHFANWERDANTLIALHKQHGVVSFKLDGIKIRSKLGEENLVRMFRKVAGETNGKVFFNLDVTAETRNGYYGNVQYGCLFLENRYTDWQGYYPHWTLRNLWMLSKYYPSFRLQVEFLNVKRNTANYEGDLLAPSVCGMEYAFAVTMFANPLAWMELTGLDEESAGILEKTISTYRKYQSEILSGTIQPIGQEPSGTGWTGLQSISGEGKGFILIIKEHNEALSHPYTLVKVKGKELLLEKILGSGRQERVQVDEDGKAIFELENKFQYCLYRYSIG